MMKNFRALYEAAGGQMLDNAIYMRAYYDYDIYR